MRGRTSSAGRRRRSRGGRCTRAPSPSRPPARRSSRTRWRPSGHPRRRRRATPPDGPRRGRTGRSGREPAHDRGPGIEVLEPDQRATTRVDEVARPVEVVRGVEHVGLDPARRGTGRVAQPLRELEHARAEVDADDLVGAEVPEGERVAPAGALKVDRPGASTVEVADQLDLRAEQVRPAARDERHRLIETDPRIARRPGPMRRDWRRASPGRRPPRPGWPAGHASPLAVHRVSRRSVLGSDDGSRLPFASATAIAAAIRDRRLSSWRSSTPACAGSRRSTRGSTRSSGSADDARERRARRRRRPRPGSAPRAAARRPVHDQGLARHGRHRDDGGHGRLGGPRAGPRRDGRRPAAGRRRHPARQDEHAGVHLVERGRQPRLRPDVEPVRPRPLARRRAAAARRRSSPPGGSPFDIGSDTRRQHPAAVAPAAASPGSSRRAAACPRTGHSPSYRGILESLTQLGPIARRVEDLALLLPIIAGPDGEDPHVAPVPLGDPAAVDVRRPARRVVRRQRHPSPDARDDGDGPSRRGRACATTGRRRRGADATATRRARPTSGTG